MKTALTLALLAACMISQGSYYFPTWYTAQVRTGGPAKFNDLDQTYYWNLSGLGGNASANKYSGLENNWNWNWNWSQPTQYRYVDRKPVPPQRVILKRAPKKVALPELKKYVLVPAKEERPSMYKDWNYLYPGTRTRDIQNRYPVPGKMDY